MTLTDIAEIYICVILTVEYFWGRSDTDIKREAKRRIRAKKEAKEAETIRDAEVLAPIDRDTGRSGTGEIVEISESELRHMRETGESIQDTIKRRPQP